MPFSPAAIQGQPSNKGYLVPGGISQSISTLVSLLQEVNASCPMLVTFSGIVTPVRLLHSANALTPIVVTLSGIIISVRLLHSKNALSPIPVTPSPIFTLFTLLLFEALLLIQPVIPAFDLIVSFPVALSRLQPTSVPI